MPQVSRLRALEVLLLLQTIAIGVGVASESVVYHCMPLTAEEATRFREREAELLERVVELEEEVRSLARPTVGREL